jgi:signal transduction histidine kinase/ActR/RegA family two-component response regulator
VVLSLALTHNLMSIHEAAVDQSKVWATQVEQIGKLGPLAQHVNAPGNDVFDTADPAGESAKVSLALASFDRQIVRVEASLQARTTPAVFAGFDADLDQVRAAMGKMNGEAAFIFNSFAANDRAAAGQRMASMDRAYAEVTTAVAAVSTRAQGEQQQYLAQQIAAARDMRQLEYLIIGLVGMMILGVAIFGHRIGKTVNRQHTDHVARQIAEEHLQEQSRLRLEAEEANQAKSVFLANMSHELRTPLNAIIGYSEMVIEDLEAENPDHASRSDMDRVVGSAKHLLSLINDILYLSKVEAGHVEIQKDALNLGEVIEEVVGIAQPLAKKSGVPLVWNPTDLGLIQSDAQKIKQCLLNLISNACKFTSEGSITIAAARTGKAGELISICVTDTGIGMTPEQLDKVFNPFQQADSSIEQRFGGTGLGLTITRQMVRMLGGDIAVESTLGVGTRVTMTIAADVATKDAVGSEIEPMVGTEDQPFVLVIEDEADARELVVRALTPAGFAVQCALTARAGMALINTRIPALVVLDICLPDASGWAFLDQIKRDKSLGNVPVVVVSTDDDRVRSLALGAAEHMVKPVHHDVLAATAMRLARAPIAPMIAETRDAA